ncbi:MAG TPA: hypothetical protein VMT00_06280 [Thermoanaerobaculia bacterium]|nr:hypothetical protein [Thermoanaerobaculia bacterium]
MWIFDGEEWISDATPEPRDGTIHRQPAPEAKPELQIVEIVPVLRQDRVVPPFPIP